MEGQDNMKAELKQLSLEMGKREYDMLQGISNGENMVSTTLHAIFHMKNTGNG